MSENSSKEGDIFDDVESFESDGKDPTLAANPHILDNNDDGFFLRPSVGAQEPSKTDPQGKQEAPKTTVVVMSHLVVKQQQASTPPGLPLHHHKPLPIMQGNHSIVHDMKFGWKPEVAFESAPIPLYFNFAEVPMQNFYEEQAYYQNAAAANHGGNIFKIIYYGPRFRDSFEMHKNFVKPSESTYEFEFPRFYGLASAKAFYDSFFVEEQGLDTGDPMLGFGSANDGGVARQQFGSQARREELLREFTGMTPNVDWDELHFNSSFENGNLDMVVRTADNTYDMFLRADTNTRGHFGWFHFEVSRTMRGRTYNFNIVNMSKSDSLHNQGMLINYWSQKRNQPMFVGWERGGFNIKYGPSRMARDMSTQRFYRQKRYSTLSFSFTFEYDDDKVWFAYTIPYTYSMLTQYIKAIVTEQKMSLEQEKQAAENEEKTLKEEAERLLAQAVHQAQEGHDDTTGGMNIDTNKNLDGFGEYANMQRNEEPPRLPKFKKSPYRSGKYLQESVLCKSLGGVEVPLITITNFDDSDWQKTRKVVFVQARLHPGETSSSWIVHGLISFLISKSRVANELRKRLVFKIVPMCNPDGVIIGNTRTTLIGKDMNRQFPLPNVMANGFVNLQSENADLPQVEESKLNPIPFAIRELLTQIQKAPDGSIDKDKIHSFFDVHQHSKKKSIFIYGPYFPLHSDKYLKIRLIPKLLSERAGDLFRFYSCRFRVERYKENTARITIGKQFGIANCFTLECSSYGYIQTAPTLFGEQTGQRATVQFKEADLIEFGKNLAECLLEYLLIMERDAKARQHIADRMRERRAKLQRAAPQPTLHPRHHVVKRSQTMVHIKKETVMEAIAGTASKAADEVSEALGGEEDNEEEGGDVVEESPLVVKEGKEDSLLEEEKYSVVGSPPKKGEPEKPSEPKLALKKDVKDDLKDDRFYSDDEEEIEEDFDEDNEEDDGDEKEPVEEVLAREAKEYEESPVTRPFDIKGLLKIKQKKSQLDIRAYQGGLPLPKHIEPIETTLIIPLNAEKPPSDKGDPSPSSSKSGGGAKGSKQQKAVVSQKKSVLSQQPQQKPYQTSPMRKQNGPRTLDQMLKLIQTDIIHEEMYENEESVAGDNQSHKGGDHSDDGGNDEDFLDAQDQRVLRDRILHAIDVFSRWSPNPKKEILKQKRAFKLSIENDRSSRKSKNSERSYSQAEEVGQSNKNWSGGYFSSPRKPSKRGKELFMYASPGTYTSKQEQMDIIDNFLKEYGLMNPLHANYNENGSVIGVSIPTTIAETRGLAAASALANNNLTLVGSKIQASQVNDIDDEVLSTISNEILRFKRGKTKRVTPKSAQSKRKGNISKKDQVQLGNNESNSQGPLKGAQTIFQQQAAANRKKSLFGLQHGNIWHLSSETNKMLIDQQLTNILSLKLDPQALRVILQKFFQQHPSAAYSLRIQQLLQAKQNQQMGAGSQQSHSALEGSLESSSHRVESALHQDEQSKGEFNIHLGKFSIERDPLLSNLGQLSQNIRKKTTVLQKEGNQVGSKRIVKNEGGSIPDLQVNESCSCNDEDIRNPLSKENGTLRGPQRRINNQAPDNLFGFEAKINTLGTMLSIKQNTLNQKKIKQGFTEFKAFQNNIVSQHMANKQKKPCTNNYLQLKHKMVSQSNSQSIHSIQNAKIRERMNRSVIIENKSDAINTILSLNSPESPKINSPAITPLRKDHIKISQEDKSEESASPSPFLITPALLRGKNDMDLKLRKSLMSSQRKLQQQASIIGVGGMVNASTDTELQNRKGASPKVRKFKTLVLEKSSTKSIIEEIHNKTPTSSDKDEKKLDVLNISHSIIHQHNGVSIKNSTPKHHSRQQSRCTKDHNKQSTRSLKSSQKRSLSGSHGSVELPDRKSDITIQYDQIHHGTQPGSPRGSSIYNESDTPKHSSIISNQAKLSQLQIDKLKDIYVELPQQFGHIDHETKVGCLSVMTPGFEFNDKSKAVPQKEYDSRSCQQSHLSSYNKGNPSKHSSITQKHINVHGQTVWVDQIANNNYDPLVQDSERVHQIGINQWIKIQKQSGLENNGSLLKIFNKSESKLHVSQWNNANDSERKALNQETVQQNSASKLALQRFPLRKNGSSASIEQFVNDLHDTHLSKTSQQSLSNLQTNMNYLQTLAMKEQMSSEKLTQLAYIESTRKKHLEENSFHKDITSPLRIARPMTALKNTNREQKSRLASNTKEPNTSKAQLRKTPDIIIRNKQHSKDHFARDLKQHPSTSLIDQEFHSPLKRSSSKQVTFEMQAHQFTTPQKPIKKKDESKILNSETKTNPKLEFFIQNKAEIVRNIILRSGDLLLKQGNSSQVSRGLPSQANQLHQLNCAIIGSNQRQKLDIIQPGSEVQKTYK